MAILKEKNTPSVTLLTNLTNLNEGFEPLWNKGERMKVKKRQTLQTLMQTQIHNRAILIL